MSTFEEFTFEISQSINYLVKFAQNQPERILYDKKSYSSLVLIGKAINSDLDYVEFDVFSLNRFDRVILNYLNKIYEIRANIDFQTKTDWKNAETAIDQNEILAQTFAYVIDIVNEIVQCSIEFCFLFVRNDCLRLCLEFLKDESFLNKSEQVKILYGNPISIPNYLTMIISNLANRTCDELKHVWTSLNAVEILLKIEEKVNQTTRLNSYHTLAYLLDDRHIETLLFEQNKMNTILDALFCLLSKVSVDFRKRDFHRISIHVHFREKPMKCEIHHVRRDDGILTSFGGILVRIYKLALNDSIKHTIYYNECIKGCFETILKRGKLTNVKVRQFETSN